MLKTIHQYYVYILASKKNGTLYIGVTYDLERRVFGHIKDAIKREKQLKKWNRKWKIELIEEENKNWNDLAKDWFN